MTITIILQDEDYTQIIALLQEIQEKIGPYKMDNHEHAISVMDNSTRNAEIIINKLRNNIAQVTT